RRCAAALAASAATGDLIAFGRPITWHAMAEYCEAFVAFDVAKKNHAVAIVEGGRRGEIRLCGETLWSAVKRRFNGRSALSRNGAAHAAASSKLSVKRGSTTSRHPGPIFSN